MTPSDLYVGYLAIPRRHRRAAQIMLPLLAVIMTASAAAIASKQTPWGDGVWEIEAPGSFIGTLVLAPYPTLITESEDGTPEAYLLVGALKSAPNPDSLTTAGFDVKPGGVSVEVTGYDLHRDGRRMISLEVDEATSITAVRPSVAPPGLPDLPVGGALGEVVIEGEILDSKCYLGAMKPGHGRGHKACAITCISGGIPPMLVTREPGTGVVRHHLLTMPDGSAIDNEELDALLPMIGEPVRVSGRSGRLGGWYTLAIDPGDISLR